MSRIFVAAFVSCWLAFAGCAKGPDATEFFEATLAEAEAGDAEAQRRVAYLYMTGRGVEANRERARLWYVTSAQQGNALAEAALAELGTNSAPRRPIADGARFIQGGTADGDMIAAGLAPRILVSDRFATRESSVLILGQVETSFAIQDVLIGGYRANVEPDGRFGIRLAVPLGESSIEISATDELGYTTTVVSSVSRLPVTDREREGVGSGIEFGRFHALLIGNNDYSKLNRLTTAVADVDAIALLLSRDYGYEVQTLYDATRTEIRFALSSYRETLTDADNLLIYYAGHGTIDDRADEAYWLPVDASSGIDTHWISNSTLSTTIRAIEARHVIVVADSCYAGTLLRSGGMEDQVESYLDRERRELRLRRMNRGRSRTALTSGANEPVVDIGLNGHSVFANAFISALETNSSVLSATDLFVDVRRSVMLRADQSPQYGDIRKTGHEAGDYLFVRVNPERSVGAGRSPTIEGGAASE